MKIRRKTPWEVDISNLDEVAGKYKDTSWGTGIMDKLTGQNGPVVGSASTSNGINVVAAHDPLTSERLPRYDTETA